MKGNAQLTLNSQTQTRSKKGYYPNLVATGINQEYRPSLEFSPSNPFYQTTRVIHPMRAVNEKEFQHFPLDFESNQADPHQLAKNFAPGNSDNGEDSDNEEDNNGSANRLHSLENYRDEKATNEKKSGLTASEEINGSRRSLKDLKKVQSFGRENAQMDIFQHKVESVSFDHALKPDLLISKMLPQSFRETPVSDTEKISSQNLLQITKATSVDIHNIKAKTTKCIEDLQSEQETNSQQNKITYKTMEEFGPFNEFLIQLENRYSDNDRYFTNAAKICERCKAVGHTNQICPEDSNKACLFCLGDHNALDCLQTVCFRCHTIGHKPNTCTIFKAPSCLRCRKKGHKADECKVIIPPRTFIPNANDENREMKASKTALVCLKCGKTGHANCNPNIFKGELFHIDEL